MPTDVTDRQHDLPVGGLERVVPVAANVHALLRGDVASRELEAGDARELRPDEGLVQHRHGAALTSDVLARGHERFFHLALLGDVLRRAADAEHGSVRAFGDLTAMDHDPR